jgi:hypothetical protein
MAPATLKASPKMATAREGHAAVRLKDGRVLLMGGTVAFVGKCPMACMPPPTASVEIYNPSTGKFSRYGLLAEPRSGGAALLLNDGRVLVSGGDNEYVGSSVIEIYDPAHGTSVVVKPPAAQQLPVYPTVVLLSDGRILVAGGSYDALKSSSTDTLIFDPASGAFSEGPVMAEPRVGAVATLLDDGRVLLVGGDYYVNYGGYATNSAELIDPSRVSSRSKVVTSQDWQTSTKLPDGRVLVMGRDQYQDDLACRVPAASEVFDPRTDRFIPVGPMSTPRSGSAAIGIADGRVLVLGGVDCHLAAVGAVEAFDPDSGTFQVIATGFPALTGFSTTLLSDGRILVAGGDKGDWNGMTAATWLLEP